MIDYVLILWLYSNPHETRRRSLASLRHVLKHIPEFQRPDGKPNVTDEELNQIVFASLQRLKERELVTVIQKAEAQQDRMVLPGDVVLDLEDDDNNANADKAGKVKSAFSRKRGFTKKRKKLRKRQQNWWDQLGLQ